jgi:hypothetical protein
MEVHVERTGKLINGSNILTGKLKHRDPGGLKFELTSKESVA